ncbi:MAG: class II glutamine amidotransferase [Croceibacterium sp.]
MCELFAVSSDRPTVLRYQLRTFAKHGGGEFRNRDGWGIMFAQERDAFLFREPAAATESALESLVAKHPPPARLVTAHIRLATAGGASLANTHPFRRTRSGRVMHFAHNGSLPNLKTRFAASEAAAACIGDTDSELAFLLLLERLRPLEPDGTPEERYAVFREFCAEMREEGTSNFLFADGELLFAHAHRRRAFVGGTPSEVETPGLCLRILKEDSPAWSARGATMSPKPENCVLLASVPLDKRKWTGLAPGTTMLVEHGRVRCQD